LDSPPPYEALSYAWGDDLTNTHSLSCEGQSLVVTDSVWLALHRLRPEAGDPLVIWIDAICIYSYRTAMKYFRNLRFMPQFSEGFHFVSKRKNSCFVYYLFSFRKGTEAALIGHVMERRGSIPEH
jgi:hypothetical protein